jgi:hypothetical protein
MGSSGQIAIEEMAWFVANGAETLQRQFTSVCRWNGTSLSPEALQRSAGTEVCNNTLFSDIAFLPQHFSRIAISLPVYSDFGTRSAV